MAANEPTLAIAAPWLLEAAAAAPRMPALERLFWRGKRRTGLPETATRLYWHLFERPAPAGDVPAGALSRFADQGTGFEGCWLRADPVHLIANRDQVMLTGAVDDLVPDESAALADGFNRLFAADGWELECGDSGWRLRTPLPCDVTTTPLDETVGRDIHPILPEGADRMAWHRFLTEMQMLLHGAGVNQSREADGRVPANSLWPWGAGELPPPTEGPWRSAFVDEGWVRGLALRSGASCESVPASARELPMAGDSVVVLPVPEVRSADDLVSRLEADWFEPLIAALRERRIARLLLYPGRGLEVAVTKGGLKRFWRCSRPLRDAL